MDILLLYMAGEGGGGGVQPGLKRENVRHGAQFYFRQPPCKRPVALGPGTGKLPVAV